MKLSPDSPELTAYALGELSADERAAVEAALAASPELRAELDALRSAADQLAREFSAEPAVELLPRQRAALVEAAAEADASARAPEKQCAGGSREAGPSWWRQILRWREQWIWAAAGACVLMLTLTLLPRKQEMIPVVDELRYQRVSRAWAEAQETPPPAPKEEALTQLTAEAKVAAKPLADAADTLAVTPTAPKTVALAESLAEAGALAGVPAAPLTPGQAAASSAPNLSFSASPVANGPTPQDRLAAGRPMAMDPVRLSRYGLSPTTPVPPAFRMDPDPARRYGLAPAGPAPQSGELPQIGVRFAEQPAAETGTKFYFPGESEARQLGWVAQSEAEVLRRGLSATPGTESYSAIIDNPFKEALAAPLSTFGLDVDTASYANVRRFLRDGSLPPRDAVRLEELINYFRYDYAAPRGAEPFAAAIEIADCPWKADHKLVRIGLQAKAVERAERPRANLVFLLDVSGSMEPENKLPLVKRSLRLLLDRLTERDSVGIVTYAGESRIALEPTAVSADGRQRIAEVIGGLRAGSGTAGAAGIVDAYRLATNRLDRESVNRVILCTDGDFNIGVSDPAGLQSLIEEKAKSGVFLSVLGYGLGNLKDSTMELLANKGNGNYGYVDSFTEARKLLVEQLEGTLVTVAKDVKVQVEFNPARVRSYRLLGYENRALRDRDFNDDTKDAGDVGAGHQITVLYETEPATPSLAGTDPLRYQATPARDEAATRVKSGFGDELLNLKLRYKAPDGEQSRLMEMPVKDADREAARASADFKFAAAVAGYGMLLRDSPYKGDLNWEQVLRLAEQGLGADKEGYRAEFVDLVRKAQQLTGNLPRPRPGF